MELTNKNFNRIKIKGTCPVCGSKVVMGSWEYVGEPSSRKFNPICTNDNCDEYYGYGGNIKIRFINHRAAKVEGLYE